MTHVRSRKTSADAREAARGHPKTSQDRRSCRHATRFVRSRGDVRPLHRPDLYRCHVSDRPVAGGDEKQVASAYAVSFGGNAVIAAFCCAKLSIVPELLTTVADDWLGCCSWKWLRNTDCRSTPGWCGHRRSPSSCRETASARSCAESVRSCSAFNPSFDSLRSVPRPTGLVRSARRRSPTPVASFRHRHKPSAMDLRYQAIGRFWPETAFLSLLLRHSRRR